MDNPLSNKHLVVMTLIHKPVRCLRSHAFSLDILAPLIDVVVINLKGCLFFIFVRKCVRKRLVYVRYPARLESSFRNGL